MRTQWTLFVLSYFIVNIRFSHQKTQINIGAIIEENPFYSESKEMLYYAVADANAKILRNTRLKLGTEVQPISYGHEYAVSKRVCNLLELEVGVILGPESISSAFHAMNICDAKEIPYINTYLDEDAASKSAVLNIHPHLDSLTQLLFDYVNVSEWKTATILYESPLWLRRVASVLENNNRINKQIRIHNLDYTTNNEFRPTLQNVRDTNDRNIILDCSTESLPIILRQAMQVGLLTKEYSWILTNLDAHSVDLEPYQYSGVNITVFRILNTKHSIFNLREWNGDESDDDVFNVDPESQQTSNNENANYCNSNKNRPFPIPTYPNKFSSPISLRLSLIYDAVMVFATAIQLLGREHVTPTQISCENPRSIWNKGYTILNFMKTIKYNGLTGNIEFDNFGLRTNITVDILELGESELKLIGTWTYGIANPDYRLRMFREVVEPMKNDIIDTSLKNKTLNVITALAKPYTMYKEEAELLTGNDRFEGYCIDLIFELSLILEFKYIFRVEDDGNYGECIDNINNEWDGMIGKVMSGEADIAITDLTVTSDRIKALDFSPSIMNLGIAILYQIPRKKEPSTFSFMAPFANEVWILLGATYICVSVCFFWLGRISPSQWENRYPCIEEPEYLENQFSIQNALWFAAGALLQQGSEIEVKSASVRLASAVWWFFTLIIVSSYTANLAAFLVAESRVTVIESVEDFAECGLDHQPPCKAKFGAKHGGSTLKFFEESKYPTFQNMYQVMMKNAHDVLVHENDDGLRRAQNENYAYLMESTSLQYYTERFCNVTQVGDLIDDRNYAIGMRKDYKYYHALSEGVLRLQELGVMDKLHTKWWKAKRGGGACQKKESSDAERLHMDHLEGVFLVLTYGSALAFLYGVFDTVRKIRKRAKSFNISFRQEMKAEFQFLLKSLANPDKPKPVRTWHKQSLVDASGHISKRTNDTP